MVRSMAAVHTHTHGLDTHTHTHAHTHTHTHTHGWFNGCNSVSCTPDHPQQVVPPVPAGMVGIPKQDRAVTKYSFLVELQTSPQHQHWTGWSPEAAKLSMRTLANLITYEYTSIYTENTAECTHLKLVGSLVKWCFCCKIDRFNCC